MGNIEKPTKEEFKKYVLVQYVGAYNMLTIDAQNAVGISTEKYNYIIRNYSALYEEYKIEEIIDEIKEKAEDYTY